MGYGLGIMGWLTERRDLDRVSDGGARAVRLDVVDLGRAAPRVVQRQPDHLDLGRVRARGRRVGVGVTSPKPEPSHPYPNPKPKPKPKPKPNPSPNGLRSLGGLREACPNPNPVEGGGGVEGEGEDEGEG